MTQPCYRIADLTDYSSKGLPHAESQTLLEKKLRCEVLRLS